MEESTYAGGKTWATQGIPETHIHVIKEGWCLAPNLKIADASQHKF